MPPKLKRSPWTPLWGPLPTPIVQRYEEDEESLSKSPAKCSQALVSNALAVLALAPAANQKRVLEITLGEDDKAKEVEFDIMVTELVAMGITVCKSVGDKQHTIWKVTSWTEKLEKPTWRYRYPRKPNEETIAPNPNIPKNNGLLHKTRRSIRRKFERTMMTGKTDIDWWKRGPGKNKSWKAYRRMGMGQLRTNVEEAPEDQTDVPTAGVWNFSAHTVPLAYLRGHEKKPVQGKRKLSFRHRREAVRLYDLSFRPHDNPSVGTAQVSQLQRTARNPWRHHFTQRFPYDATAEHMASPNPIKPTPRVQIIKHEATAALTTPAKPRKASASVGTGDFLRLIVGIGGKTEIVSENYLSGDVTIATTPARKQGDAVTKPSKMSLSISAFLRHDSHADVYAVNDLASPLSSYEGHLFFCHGLTQSNWARYGTRKMDRLRKSKLFVGETKAKERPLIVVTVAQREAPQPKRTGTEFPSLSKIEAKPNPTKSTRRKSKVTYAIVAHRGNPSHEVVKLKHPSNRYAYRAWQSREDIRKGSQSWEVYHRKNGRRQGQNLAHQNGHERGRINRGGYPRRNAHDRGTTARRIVMGSLGRGMDHRGLARYNPRSVFRYVRGREGRSCRFPELKGWGLTQEMYSSSSFSSSNRFAMLFA